MAWGFSGAVYMKLTTSLLTLTSALNYGGVTLSNSVTGTGSMVLSASPTFTGGITTPQVAVSSGGGMFSVAGSVFLQGQTTALLQISSSTIVTVAAGSVTLAQPLVYGGVTLSNSVTGTGSMVLSASPTLTGTINGSVAIFSSSVKLLGSAATQDGGFLYTPFNGATDTGLIRAGIQFDGSSQSMNIYTNNTYRGGWGSTGVLTLGAALTYGGVTLSNSVTGTGSMVLSASPTFTGSPLTPTQSPSSNNTTIASTAYVDAGIAAITTVPTGTVLPYAGSTTAPTGFLMANGQAVSRSTYSALFAVTSTTFGVGDGSTTFNVPDLRGRAVFGDDSMGSTAANRLGSNSSTGGISGTASRGTAGGAQNHTLITAEMPAHTHSVPAQIVGGSDIGGSGAYLAAGLINNGTSTSTGGGGAHNNTPPALVMNFIIKH